MRIAVSGIGIISALGRGAEENLRALAAGRSGVGKLTQLDSRHDLPVGEVKMTNHLLQELVGIAPRAAMSRTTLLGIAAVQEALEDAAPEGSLRVGLVSATSVGGMDLTEQFYADFLRDPSRGRISLLRQHDPSQSTARIAAHCGIKGYTTTISTACSSAANAILFAGRLLEHNLCDVVVAGGCDALSRFTLDGFLSLGILDPALCRPFDASRAGLNLGEGAGYVVLQREETLRKTPYAYFAGGANANDAFHQTASSDQGEGAYRAMHEALTEAGISPVAIGYINAHGTGTPNNDLTEAVALQRIFGENVPPFSSTKAFTGHTLAAAGGIEAVFSVLALKHSVRYENLNFHTPIAAAPLIPCRAFEENMPLEYVLSNSFGFGGNDTSLIFSKS